MDNEDITTEQIGDNLFRLTDTVDGKTHDVRVNHHLLQSVTGGRTESYSVTEIFQGRPTFGGISVSTANSLEEALELATEAIRAQRRG